MRLIITEKVSKFSFGDFNDMLSYHGLQVQEVFGDYQLGNYDVRAKPRLIIVAVKDPNESKFQRSTKIQIIDFTLNFPFLLTPDSDFSILFIIHQHPSSRFINSCCYIS